MDKEYIKTLLKEKSIHKSFLNIFVRCNELDNLHLLIDTFDYYDKNKNILNYSECDFREYFNDFNIIKMIDINLYKESCELIILENKTNSYINRTIKKEYRPLAYSHENYNLCMYLVKDGVCLDAFKSYMSNIQHINTHSILFRSLNRMLLEHHTWSNSFQDNVKEFQDIPTHHFLIKEKNELLFFAGECFDTHSQLGAPNWCSTQANDYYHFSLNFMEKIYFHFDFNRKYYDPLSLTAIITDDNNNILQVFDKFNNEIKNNNNHVEKIIKEKGFQYTTNVTKNCDALTKSFHSFKKNNKHDAIRYLKEYNNDQKSSMEHAKKAYYYYFLLPKILHSFKAKEVESYFNLIDENNIYILSPHFEKYNVLEEFELGCIKNSNVKLAYRYLTEGDSNLLKGKNKNQLIKAFERKKMLNNRDISIIFWNLFLYSKDTQSKNQFLSIFSNIIHDINEEYTEKELRAVFVNYINFYQMTDEYMRVGFINRLIALAYIDISCDKSFCPRDFYLILQNIKSIFEESLCTIMQYKIEEDILFNMINSIDHHNPDMLNAFYLFLFENYSISTILKNNCIIDDVIINIISNNKNEFSYFLKKRLKEFKIDFSFVEKKEVSLSVIQALLTTLNQNELEDVLGNTKCLKTQQLYIDLVSNIK